MATKIYTPAELEKMSRTGQLLMLTGDDVVSPIGAVHVQRSADIEDAQRDTEEKQLQRLLLDRYYGAQEARWAREPEEAAKDRALERELKLLGLWAKNQDKGDDQEKLTASQETQANEYATALQEIRGMKSRAARLPGISSKGKAFGVELARSVVPEQFKPLAGQWATEKAYTPEESQLIRDLNSQLATRVKLLSGAAASDKERDFIMSFMPRAGMRTEDLMSSLDTLEQFVSERATRARAPGRALLRDTVTTPTKPSGPRKRKTIGGKTFVQVGPDEWEEE